MRRARSLPESPKDELLHVEQEAQIVLPGIQALFGFQFIAVFNNRFESLPLSEQVLHWVALALTAVSTILIMGPSAYHRQKERHSISNQLLLISTKWLTRGMLVLPFSVGLDFFIVGNMVLRNAYWSALASLVLLGAYLWLWFVFPNKRLLKRQRWLKPLKPLM